MWLLAVFVAIPLIEIALFIQVGGFIGLWPTLLIVLATAVAGTSLVRSQGALAMGQLRRSLNDMRDPTEPLAHGAMILLAGALLVTPGFFTDALGLSLLMPPVRRRVFSYLAKRVEVKRFSYGSPHRNPADPPHGDVIEGDYDEIDVPEPNPDRKPSGWTRH